MTDDNKAQLRTLSPHMSWDIVYVGYSVYIMSWWHENAFRIVVVEEITTRKARAIYLSKPGALKLSGLHKKTRYGKGSQ